MTSFLCLFVSLSGPASAFNGRSQGIGPPGSLTQKVRVIGKDGRNTEQEYSTAKGQSLGEIEDRFAATGLLNCKKSRASAQLTGDGWTLTTAAHVFKSRENKCKLSERPENCVFHYRSRGIEKTAKITSIFKIGYQCTKPNSERDWAILKLADEVRDIEPYDLPGEWDHPYPDLKVISVSARTVDFTRFDKISGKLTNPKSIEDCTVKFTYRSRGDNYMGATLFQTDCDSDHGSSGGSILRLSENRLKLIGVTRGGPETKVGDNRFVLDAWATNHEPLYGEFLDTVKGMMGKPH